MPKPSKFKPYIRRMFYLKNYTDLKKFPEVILVMDETNKEVMFLDNNQIATWVSKFYLRTTPVESRVYASPDTLTEAMTLLETLRTAVVEGEVPNDKKKKELNKQTSNMIVQLRDLGTRMEGVRFAPPEQPASEEAVEESTTSEVPRS